MAIFHGKMLVHQRVYLKSSWWYPTQALYTCLWLQIPRCPLFMGETIFPMTDPNGAAILMVCHGSHQSIYPLSVSIYIPAPWIRHGFPMFFHVFVHVFGAQQIPPITDFRLIPLRLARYHQLITGALFVAALIVLAIFPSFDRRRNMASYADQQKENWIMIDHFNDIWLV